MAGLYGDASRAVGRAASSGAGAGGATADDSDEEDEGESPPVRQVGSMVSSAMAGLYGDASRAVGRVASSGAGAGDATGGDSDEEDEGDSPPVRQVGSTVSSAMAGLYGDASRAVGGTTASEAVEGLMSPGRSSSGLPTPSSDGNTSKAAREPMQPVSPGSSSGGLPQAASGQLGAGAQASTGASAAAPQEDSDDDGAPQPQHRQGPGAASAAQEDSDFDDDDDDVDDIPLP